MNDENQGEKKEGRPRRRFPRRRRSSGNTEGAAAAQSGQSQGAEPRQRDTDARPLPTPSSGDGAPRSSRPPQRTSRAPETSDKTSEQPEKETPGGGGSRSRSNRRRRGERRPTDGTQSPQPQSGGQSREGDNRSPRISRPPISGNRNQGDNRAAGRPGERTRLPGRLNDTGEGRQSNAGRSDTRGRGGPRNDGRPRSDEGNRGRIGTPEVRNSDRAGDRRDFREGPTKKDSMLPEPFLREEVYSAALEKETAGYKEMTEDQLVYLKTTVIGDNVFEDGEADFVIPDNAVLMDVAGVKLHHADPVLMFDSKDLHLAVGDRVVVETKKGLALGSVLRDTCRCYVKQHNLPRVIRKMSQGDIRQEERNKEKEQAALAMCKERIDQLRLPMKLIEVEYLHGGNKAVFYFAAEGRVDFRELVRDLAQRLHTRIEMRQIGVRDVSRIVGGIGICGCQLCCNLWLREFKPISIRMAKDQNLVLNPQKVSGVCGRLLCCLTYENEVYQKAAQTMPRVGRRVFTPDGEGRIRDRDVLKRTVRVQLNEENQFRDYHVDELEFASGRSPEDTDLESEAEAREDLRDDMRGVFRDEPESSADTVTKKPDDDPTASS